MKFGQNPANPGPSLANRGPSSDDPVDLAKTNQIWVAYIKIFIQSHAQPQFLLLGLRNLTITYEI